MCVCVNGTIDGFVPALTLVTVTCEPSRRAVVELYGLTARHAHDELSCGENVASESQPLRRGPQRSISEDYDQRQVYRRVQDERTERSRRRDTT